jgi:hypothetical protein
MADKRRKFDAEFREGAVRIVAETGKPLAQGKGQRRCKGVSAWRPWWQATPWGTAQKYSNLSNRPVRKRPCRALARPV